MVVRAHAIKGPSDGSAPPLLLTSVCGIGMTTTTPFRADGGSDGADQQLEQTEESRKAPTSESVENATKLNSDQRSASGGGVLTYQNLMVHPNGVSKLKHGIPKVMAWIAQNLYIPLPSGMKKND